MPFNRRRKEGASQRGQRPGPPLRFYLSIESFLDTAVKRTIDQATIIPALSRSTCAPLQLLFLIRYVDQIKGNIENLVTLCTDQIDAGRSARGSRIEDALGGWRRRRSSTATATVLLPHQRRA